MIAHGGQPAKNSLRCSRGGQVWKEGGRTAALLRRSPGLRLQRERAIGADKDGCPVAFSSSLPSTLSTVDFVDGLLYFLALCLSVGMARCARVDRFKEGME